MGKKLKGRVSTRVSIGVEGYRTRYVVHPGLQDTIVPIATAHLNALASKSLSTIYITHDNRYPAALPNNLEGLVLDRSRGLRPGLASGLIPY